MTDSQVSTIDDPVEAKKPRKAAVAEVAKGKSNVEGLSGKMEIITIHSERGEGGGDAVPVGLNGYLYQIPRDEPFEVPTEVAHILRNAVTTTIRPGANGVNTERSMPRHAFSAVPA